MKVEQKLIRVTGRLIDNFDYIDENLLNMGFIVKQISASTSKDGDCCYVLYERAIDDEKTQMKQTKNKENSRPHKTIADGQREFEDYLETLFNECKSRLIFRRRFTPPWDDIVYYIGFEDMKKKQYNIRQKVGETFDDINDPIIGTYKSIRDILYVKFDGDNDWISELEEEWKEDWWEKNFH
ncbi:MAG: hypothetical protein IJG81_05445 [Muribaculaceae bacterium]|nr:hypothetical protein [Muribaculaceae bacterium]